MVGAAENLPIRTAQGEQRHDPVYALIEYEDSYVQPLILSAMESLFPADSWTRIRPPSTFPSTAELELSRLVPSPQSRILQITPYESIDWDHADRHPTTTLINSYTIRKALIRKHFLSATVDAWVAKHPDSVLRSHVKRSEAFEVDYAEFLDDALIEAFDLRASLERNEALGDEENGTGDDDTTEAGGLPAQGAAKTEREWWILKPSMSDRGQGIRLFSTMDELQEIFDGWEGDESESEEDDEQEDDDDAKQQHATGQDEEGEGAVGEDAQSNDNHQDKDYIMASHLRHFVAQPYIDPPLLLPGLDNRKFHIRTYVLAVGSLKVYVYENMLALFAAKPYQPPSSAAALAAAAEDGIDLDAHLTNTCLQGPDGAVEANSVHRFLDLPLPAEQRAAIAEQIYAVTGELFEAAARGMMVHFQPLENAFEVYGLDFLVDAAGTAWLLEVNAFPDFKQTGTDGRLQDVVSGFWAEVLRLAVGPFIERGKGELVDKRKEEEEKEEKKKQEEVGSKMVLVRDVDLGRRWAS